MGNKVLMKKGRQETIPDSFGKNKQEAYKLGLKIEEGNGFNPTSNPVSV